MKRRKKVTMQDIADQLGVSKVTVSKALNGKDGVGEERKKIILRKAKELGYITKQTPQEPTKGNVVIYLDSKYFVEGSKGFFYVKMYQLITKYLREKGYQAMLSTVDADSQGKELEDALMVQHVAGVIMLGKLEESFLAKVRKLTLPLVYVDYYDELSDAECVLTENIYSTYQITKHLIERGHYLIGYVGSIYITKSILDRYLGFSRALLERHISVNHDWILEDRDYDNEAIEFDLPEKMPTAFVCNCDETAHRFMKRLQREGYGVPEDISIVSFDNDIHANLCDPKLTTVAVDVDHLARTTAGSIKKQIENNTRNKGKITRINGKIIYRDSVGTI